MCMLREDTNRSVGPSTPPGQMLRRSQYKNRLLSDLNDIMLALILTLHRSGVMASGSCLSGAYM